MIYFRYPFQSFVYKLAGGSSSHAPVFTCACTLIFYRNSSGKFTQTAIRRLWPHEWYQDDLEQSKVVEALACASYGYR